MAASTAPVTGRPKARPAGRGFWPMRDLPVVGWLLATLLVALAHPFLPAPRWLLIHLVLLGAATHSILVWSRYFTDALLHTPPDPRDRPRQNRRLVVLNLGVLLVVAGVVTTWWPATVAGGTAVAAAVVWHGVAPRAPAARGPARPLRPDRPLLRRRRGAAPGGRHDRRPRGPGAGGPLAPAAAGRPRLGQPARLDRAGRARHAGHPVADHAPDPDRRRDRALRPRAPCPCSCSASRWRPVAPWRASSRPPRWATCSTWPGSACSPPPWCPRPGRSRRGAFPTFSVASALAWLAGCLVAVVVALATAPTWAEAADRFGWFTPFLAAGFGAQLLLGALSYLVPVVLGGGPGPVRAATAVLDRGGLLRVAVTNVGLLLCALPVPAAVRVLCSVVVLVALASFLPLLVLAMRASRKVRAGLREAPAGDALVGCRAAPPGGAGDRRRHRGRRRRRGRGPGLVTAPSATNRSRPGPPPPVGRRSSRSRPTTCGSTLPASRCPPVTGWSSSSPTPTTRTSTTWCSTTAARPAGSPPASRRGSTSAWSAATSRAGARSSATTRWGWRSRSASSARRPSGRPGRCRPPTPTTTGRGGPAGDARAATSRRTTRRCHRSPPGRVHRHTLHVRDAARGRPGVTQELWTFNGTAPGPMLHGRVGDRFVITLVNDGTMGHSIDFHAGVRAPDEVMRTIPPGESLDLPLHRPAGRGLDVPLRDHADVRPHRQRACSAPWSSSRRACRRWTASTCSSSPSCTSARDGAEVDLDKVAAEQPDAVVFNGYADQYDHARRSRAAPASGCGSGCSTPGPSRATSFHVVGGQFDTRVHRGRVAARQRTGAGPAPPAAPRCCALLPAQGGFVELVLRRARRLPVRQPRDGRRRARGPRGAAGQVATSARDQRPSRRPLRRRTLGSLVVRDGPDDAHDQPDRRPDPHGDLFPSHG